MMLHGSDISTNQQVIDSPVGSESRNIYDTEFVLTIGIVFLLSFAVMMLLIGIANIRDLEMLKTAPELVWNFICGRPVDGNIGMPLLLTLSIVGFLASGALFGWKIWRKRNI